MYYVDPPRSQKLTILFFGGLNFFFEEVGRPVLYVDPPRSLKLNILFFGGLNFVFKEVGRPVHYVDLVMLQVLQENTISLFSLQAVNYLIHY